MTASGTAYKRDYDHGFGLTADWGGVKDKDGNYHNFTVYTSLKLLFKNTGSSTLTVCLFMNTGFTSEAPYYSLNDTFWQGDWTDVPAGQSRVVSIDFSSATCYNAADDPEPSYNTLTDGKDQIFRLDQVTNVGLQVLQNPVVMDWERLLVQDTRHLPCILILLPCRRPTQMLRIPLT